MSGAPGSRVNLKPGELADDELLAVDAGLTDARLSRDLLGRFRANALARVVVCDLVSQGGVRSRLSVRASSPCAPLG